MVVFWGRYAGEGRDAAGHASTYTLGTNDPGNPQVQQPVMSGEGGGGR